MKKELLSIFFFSAVLFFSPLNANGAVVELTVTIDSLRIPERAEAVVTDDRPDTEFILPSASLVILDKNGDIAQPNIDLYYSGFDNNESSDLMFFKKNSFATTDFTYDVNLAPYQVYIDIPVTKQSVDSTVFTADCSPHTYLIDGVAWYYTAFRINEKEIDNGKGILNIYHVCPRYACNNENECYNNDYLAFEPTNIVRHKGYNIGQFWRSPSIYSINLD